MLKELIKLSNLCNFQLFASSIEGNIRHQKLRNCWVAKKLMSRTSPVKFGVFRREFLRNILMNWTHFFGEADAHVTNWLRVEINAMLKYSYISIRCVNAPRQPQSQFNFSLISSKSIRHLFTNVKRFQKLPWLRNTCIKSIKASVVKKLFSTGG